MARWLVLVLGAAGCSSGGEGADSSPSGIPATAGDCRAVWVDDENQPVWGAVILPEGLGYVDGDGNVWALEASDGQIYTFGGATVYYADEACTEPWIAGDTFLPRYVIDINGEHDGYYVRPDGLEARTYEAAYRPDGAGGCAVYGGVYPLVGLPLFELTAVSMPVVTWSPPLHPELP